MDNNPNYISSPSNALKRPRNPDQWKKNIPRKRRNLGKEYTSYSTGIYVLTIIKKKLLEPNTQKF